MNNRYWGRKPLLYSIRFHRKLVENCQKNTSNPEDLQKCKSLVRKIDQLEKEIKTAKVFDPFLSYYFQAHLAHIEKKLLHWQKTNEPEAIISIQHHRPEKEKTERTTLSPVPIGKHQLPPLPYAYHALEPYIDEKTMRLHHDKHHQSYVNGLNRAEIALEKARQRGDYQLVKHWSRELAFHGSGHYLHTIFWCVMNPDGGGKPSADLMQQIKRDFGSFERFQKHFSEAAEQVEGGGWAILVWSPRSHRLEILQAEKHQNLTQWDVIPLLPLDVWEHAYYLKYQNNRKEYIRNWWEVVYWPEVEKRFSVAKKVLWKPY